MSVAGFGRPDGNKSAIVVEGLATEIQGVGEFKLRWWSRLPEQLAKEVSNPTLPRPQGITKAVGSDQQHLAGMEVDNDRLDGSRYAGNPVTSEEVIAEDASRGWRTS